MNETIMLIKYAEENARYKAALNLLKELMIQDKGDKTRQAMLNENELNSVLAVAGMMEKEVNVITFDNAPDEVAYEC